MVKRQAERRKYHFIYKTICLINGKFYYGMHSTDNLEDGYVGSGTRLWHSIKKYGRENFKLEVLEFCPDRETLKLRESELINADMLKDPNCMNLKIGGEGGWETVNKNKTIEERSRLGKLGGYANLTFEQRSAAGKCGYDKLKNVWKEYPELMESNRKKATEKASTKEVIEKRKITYLTTKHQQGEKNSQFGTCWICHQEFGNKKIKLEALQEFIDEGWIRGKLKKYAQLA
jgi:hypothetical protein